MSRFVGTYYKRDVALVEQSLDSTKYSPITPGADGSLASFVTFATVAGKGTITSVDVESVSIQGQSFANDVFQISSTEAQGTYNIVATINGTKRNIAVPIALNTALNVQRVLGKLTVSSLPAVSATELELSDELSVSITVAGGSDLNLFVDIDDVGKPDLTFPQTCTVTGSESPFACAISYHTFTVANPSFAFAFTAGNTAGAAAAVSDLEVESISIPASTYTASASPEANGSIVVANGGSIILHCKKLSGIDGTTGDAVPFNLANVDLDLKVSAETTIATAYSTAADRVLLAVLDADNEIAAADITVGGISFTAPKLVLKANGALVPIGATFETSNTAFKLETELLSSGSGATVPLLLAGKKLDFEEVFHFHDVNHKDIVTINAGLSFYDKFVEPRLGSILNVDKDAGFIIPVEKNGVVENKYVRISDLYAGLGDGSSVPDLADRLHALEVALSHVTNEVIEDSTSDLAKQLLKIKQTYSVLDISAII